jgi:hypothetical protein
VVFSGYYGIRPVKFMYMSYTYTRLMFSQDIFVYIYSVFLPLVYLVELYYKN